MSAPERLRPDRMRAALRSVTIGREMIVLEEIGSTNDAIANLAKEGAAEGVVIFAEHQTAGRGQRGNRWSSPAGKGLCFSVLLRPEIEVKDSAQLTTWAAHNVADTISEVCQLDPIVKLPNDVYVNGRKVAGVLVEMKAQSRTPHLAILGVGLNVNESIGDFPPELRERATSLAIATGRKFDRDQLAIQLLRNLDRTYREVATPQLRP